MSKAEELIEEVINEEQIGPARIKFRKAPPGKSGPAAAYQYYGLELEDGEWVIGVFDVIFKRDIGEFSKDDFGATLIATADGRAVLNFSLGAYTMEAPLRDQRVATAQRVLSKAVAKMAAAEVPDSLAYDDDDWAVADFYYELLDKMPEIEGF